MVRAEKRKFAEEQEMIHDIKKALFPNGDLQERVENIMPFHARRGRDFIKVLYDHSLTLEQNLPCCKWKTDVT
jgi:uncharacterized protein YllA (UPF0747 family)